MRFLIFINVFFTFIAYSQEEFLNTHDSIYNYNGQFFKKSNDSLFNGTIKFIKKNGTITSNEVYLNGYLTKEFKYYNKSAKDKVYIETQFYHPNNEIIKEKEIYYHSNGKVYKIIYFDELGKKKLENLYENDLITYSCEYKNGKKHGKEICKDKKCGAIENEYVNGKKIDNQ